MENTTVYFVVKQRALPEVLLKVVEANRLIDTQKAASVQEAVDMVGISRSSYYKYKDDIFPFHDSAQGTTLTLLIEIESAIADTQYQIDRFETSQRSIDRQVDLSEVYLTLMEQEQTVINPELTLAERIRAGFADSIEWLGDFGRDLIVFVVMASPVIGIGAAVWLVWKLIRKFKKREE